MHGTVSYGNLVNMVKRKYIPNIYEPLNITFVNIIAFIFVKMFRKVVA